MTFRRTNSGLSNHHLFYDVQIVMYVEGGRASLSLQDLSEGASGSDATLDAAFWKETLHAVGCSKRIKVISIGSKPTLLEIASGIADGSLRNVYVGIDRDFDMLDSDLAGTPGVMYTFGYSWENDVWSTETLLSVCGELCPHHEISEEIAADLSSAVAAFLRDIQWTVAVDKAQASAGLDRGLLTRPGLVVQVRPGVWPCLSRSPLANLVAQARAALKAVGVRVRSHGVVSRADCCGKVLGAFFYFAFVAFLERVGEPTQVSRNLLNGAALSAYAKRLRLGLPPEILAHYQQQVARAVGAV